MRYFFRQIESLWSRYTFKKQKWCFGVNFSNWIVRQCSNKKKKRFKVKKKRFPLNDGPRKNRFRGKKNNAKKQEIDIDDESRFNSEEYHQKQHDL